MNPEDQRMNPPADAGELAAPSTSAATSPPRGEGEAGPAPSPDVPAAKSMAAAKPAPEDSAVAVPPVPHTHRRAGRAGGTAWLPQPELDQSPAGAAHTHRGAGGRAATSLPRDEGEAGPAPRPDEPAAKSMDSAVAVPPVPTTWSPSDNPNLVFSWSVVRTDDPAVSRFPTKVNFFAAGGSREDPQSLLVDVTVSSDRAHVRFSVSEQSGRSPFLSGTLNYEQGPTSASLTVTHLKYPGGAILRQVLEPSP
jgi:hypothetical protein